MRTIIRGPTFLFVLVLVNFVWALPAQANPISCANASLVMDADGINSPCSTDATDGVNHLSIFFGGSYNLTTIVEGSRVAIDVLGQKIKPAMDVALTCINGRVALDVVHQRVAMCCGGLVAYIHGPNSYPMDEQEDSLGEGLIFEMFAIELTFDRSNTA